jgi:hypothetical protein
MVVDGAVSLTLELILNQIVSSKHTQQQVKHALSMEKMEGRKENGIDTTTTTH